MWQVCADTAAVQSEDVNRAYAGTGSNGAQLRKLRKPLGRPVGNKVLHSCRSFESNACELDSALSLHAALMYANADFLTDRYESCCNANSVNEAHNGSLGAISLDHLKNKRVLSECSDRSARQPTIHSFESTRSSFSLSPPLCRDVAVAFLVLCLSPLSFICATLQVC